MFEGKIDEDLEGISSSGELVCSASDHDVFIFILDVDGRGHYMVAEPLTVEDLENEINTVFRGIDPQDPNYQEELQYFQTGPLHHFQQWKKKNRLELEDGKISKSGPEEMNPQTVMAAIDDFTDGQLRHLQGLIAAALKKKITK
jgi:hypothetical protein